MTRPLPHFKVGSPTTSINRQEDIDDIRYNQLVMYINAALYGGIGWTGPTYDFDDQQRATQAIRTNLDDVVQVRLQYTYYTSGPGDGLCHTATLAYSDDTGATWYTIGTMTYTYTPDGNMLPPAWTYA